MKPDALAHLADALMEDIVATPPHQLAIEEIVEAGRSRELVFRFDDILADAITLAGERPASLGSSATWNLTDALCEDIAAHPDETVLIAVSGDRSNDRSLPGEFDDILRRDRHLAMAGLKLPRQPGLWPPALYVKATLAQLLDRLIAPLHSRVAAGALGAVVTAAIMAVIIYQPWRQTVEPGFATTLLAPPKSPMVVAHPVPLPAPVEVENAGSAAKSEAAPPPPATAADGGELRVAAVAPEPPKSPVVAPPAPLPAPAEAGSAGSAAKSEASPPPAIDVTGSEMRVAAASPEPPKSPVVAPPAPLPAPVEIGNAGSAAKSEAAPPPAMAADGDEKRDASRRAHTAVAVSQSPAVSAPAPDRKQRTTEADAAGASAQEAVREDDQKRMEAVQRREEEQRRLEALQRVAAEQKRLEALRQRVEEEQKRLEALRRQEEERLVVARLETAQAEERKRMETLRQQEEQRRVEALRQQAEEEKRVEAREALFRQQEEQRQKEGQQLALLRPQDGQSEKPSQGRTEGFTSQSVVLANLPAQLRLAQAELRRLGCLNGASDSQKLDDVTRNAVKALWQRIGKPISVEVNITDEFINELRQQRDAVCVPPKPPQLRVDQQTPAAHGHTIHRADAKAGRPSSPAPMQASRPSSSGGGGGGHSSSPTAVGF